MLSIKNIIAFTILVLLASSLLLVHGSKSFRDSIPVIGADELGTDETLFNDLNVAAAIAGDEVFQMPAPQKAVDSVRSATVTNQIDLGKMELETFSGFSSEVCECNDHTETCNPDTGICSDCTGHTTGNHCELCLPGYSGDATIGDCSDITPPVLICPENKHRTATSSSGTAVTWTAPNATDTTGGFVELESDYTSGAVFPIGITKVTYKATDVAGNAARCSFNITVVDTISFSTGCPASISLTTSSSSGVSTTWTKPVVTSASGSASVTCTSTSGSTYPIGTTSITCSASTTSGLSVSCQFNIVVSLVTLQRSFTWSAPVAMQIYNSESVGEFTYVYSALGVTDTGAKSNASIIVTASITSSDSQASGFGVRFAQSVSGVDTVPSSATSATTSLKITGLLPSVNTALKQLALYVPSGSAFSLTLSVSDFTNTSISTSVVIPITVSCRSTAAAPTVSSARFSSTGATIVVTFSRTFVSNATGTGCAQWFQSTSLLGSGATCSVTSSTVLTVTLGSSATIGTESSLTFMSNMIRACSASSLYLSGSITPAAPTTPATPTVTISGSNRVISCVGAYLTLTSTASGASRFTYSWSVPEAVSSVTKNASSVVIPISQLTTGSSYTFTLTVTSWLGGTASASKTVAITSELVPILTVSGDASRTLSSTVSNQISVTATAPSCLSSADAALGTVFSWSVSPTNTALTTALSSASGRTVTIPANAMAASKTYVFTLSAYFVANSKNSSSTTITVTTSSIPVVARIANGDRAVGRTSTVSLSGSKSTAGTGVTLSYKWSCATSSGSSCALLDGSGDLTLTAASTGTSFSASVLSSGAYVITLNVTGSDGQWSTASVTITILAGSAPQLGLTSSAPSSGVIASSSPLRLSSVLIQADTAVTYSWSETSGHGIDLSSYSSRSLYLNSAGTNGYWIQGATYTFRVYATLVGSDTAGYADVSVTINQSPVGGVVTSDLASSQSMVDSITLSTSGWADANGDAISYQFFYISTAGSRVLLGSKGTDSSKSGITLPPGDSSNSNQLTVGVRATDAYGAYNDATTTVISTSPDVLSSGNSTALASFFASTVAAALATGDTEAVYSAATIVASTLSTSCNPDLANTLAASLVSGASTAPLDQGIAALTAISNPACSLGSDTASNVLNVLGPLAARVDASDPEQLTNVFGTVGQLYEGMSSLDSSARGALLVQADNVMRSLATAIVSDSGALQSAGDAYQLTVGDIQTSLVLVDPSSDADYSVSDDTGVTVPSGVVSGSDNVVLRVYVQPRPTETTGSSQLGSSRLTIEVATASGEVYTSFGSSSTTGRRLLSSGTGMNVTMAYNATILSSCGGTTCTPICVAWNSTDNTWTSSSSIVVTVSASNGVANCQLYQSATLSVASVAVVDSTSSGSDGGNYNPDYSYDDDLDERNKKLYIAGAVLIGCGIILGGIICYRAGKKKASARGPTAEMASFVAATPDADYGSAQAAGSAPGAPGPVHLVVVSNDDIASRFQAANPAPHNAGVAGSRSLDNFGSDGAADDFHLPARSPSNGDDSDSSSGYRPVRSPMGPDAGSVAVRNPVLLHD